MSAHVLESWWGLVMAGKAWSWSGLTNTDVGGAWHLRGEPSTLESDIGLELCWAWQHRCHVSAGGRVGEGAQEPSSRSWGGFGSCSKPGGGGLEPFVTHWQGCWQYGGGLKREKQVLCSTGCNSGRAGVTRVMGGIPSLCWH